MNIQLNLITRLCVLKVIEINVTLLDGTNQIVPIASHSKVVDLSNKSIIAADLTELDNLEDLEEINLSGNSLMTIDLTVLAFCPAIRTVSLNDNKLQ
ncbi:MAG: hypothetical protein ACFFEL_08670, partial [Candidatus Thorarchaeota archaeon]